MKSWFFFVLFLLVFRATPILSINDYESLHQIIENFAFTHPGNISVSFTDLTNDRTVSVAPDRLFNPASVIKVAVMVEVYRQVALKRLSLDDKIVMHQRDKVGGSGTLQFQRSGGSYSVRYLVEQMITISDNTATYLLINRVGKANINRTMRRLGLRSTMIGEANLLKAEGINFSTAGDMGLLFTRIYHKDVISKEASDEMLAILGRQHVKWGIPKYLPVAVRVANKTGTLAYVKNDAGIVFLEGRPYVLSVFTSKAESRPFATTWVAQISRLVFDWRTGEGKGYGYVN
ncbi:serine hydrolase [bacterium]|nr:serine hydrolase [bacterium]